MNLPGISKWNENFYCNKFKFDIGLDLTSGICTQSFRSHHAFKTFLKSSKKKIPDSLIFFFPPFSFELKRAITMTKKTLSLLGFFTFKSFVSVPRYRSE